MMRLPIPIFRIVGYSREKHKDDQDKEGGGQNNLSAAKVVCKSQTIWYERAIGGGDQIEEILL